MELILHVIGVWALTNKVPFAHIMGIILIISLISLNIEISYSSSIMWPQLHNHFHQTLDFDLNTLFDQQITSPYTLCSEENHLTYLCPLFITYYQHHMPSLKSTTH